MKLDEDTLAAAFVIGIIGLFLWSRRNNNVATFDPTPPNSFDNVLANITPRHASSTEDAIIEQEEGFTATPKADAQGTQEIGYGHQIQPGESYTTVTEAQAGDLFESDLIPVENAIIQNVTVALNQNQFDALVNFVYNVGVGAFKSSTLLAKLNQGDYAGASQEFTKWVNSDGQVSTALQSREAGNQTLFNS